MGTVFFLFLPAWDSWLAIERKFELLKFMLKKEGEERRKKSSTPF